jgi:hypothetical protein
LNELPDFAHDQAVHLVVASIRIDTNVRFMYPILHLLFKTRQEPRVYVSSVLSDSPGCHGMVASSSRPCHAG